MNGHRFQINHWGIQLLYKHFNLPDHSILSMKVRILEKIYHPTNNHNLSTPCRRKREEYWIRQLGTAAPYGYNDHIDCIGNLTSPGCQSVNVLNLFDRTSRRPRSHGSRRYNKPEIHDVSFDGLLPFVNFTVRSSSYSYKTVLSSIENATWIVRIYIDLTFCWRCISGASTSGYHFGYFLQQTFQRCQCVNLQKQGTALFWMLNLPIKALTLWI